jgi:hypothetical protein
MNEATEKADIKKAVRGIFCDEIDLVEDVQGREDLFRLINRGRERMVKLDPVSGIAVRGGNEQLRAANTTLLRMACESAMFRLSHDDPRSNTASWMKEDGRTEPPFLFREIPPIIMVDQGPDKPAVKRPGVVICLNGAETHNVEKLKNDFIAELGLVLTEVNLRSLYPRQWEGKQAFTTRTAHKE